MDKPIAVEKESIIPFGSYLNETEIQSVIDNSNVVTFNKKEIIFRQNTRTSHIMFIKSGIVKIFKEGRNGKYIILKVALKLLRKNPKKVKENIAAYLAQKRKSQDLSAKSAGCIFKNPQHRLTAGKMIAACGLKQRRRGQAEISTRHANYIINRNGAKARDILYLINLAQREVKKKFGVLLEPEIRILK